jgi:hypothetical protein
VGKLFVFNISDGSVYNSFLNGGLVDDLFRNFAEESITELADFIASPFPAWPFCLDDLGSFSLLS